VSEEKVDTAANSLPSGGTEQQNSTPQYADKRGQIRTALAYVLTGLITAGILAVILKPWAVGPGVFAIGGDDLWLQASAQVAAHVGPFGIDPNLGWPSGYSLWSVPQLGILLGTLLWILGGVLGVGSAGSVLWAVAVSGGITAMACLFLLRSVAPGCRWAYAVPLAIALGAPPAGLVVIGHLNVSTWSLVPLLVGITFRLRRATGRARVWLLLAALAVSLVSPLWWLIVFALMIGLMIIIGLVSRDWRGLQNRLWVTAMLLVGLMAQIVIFRNYPNLSGSESRGRWDSNVFGGHLVDFVVASPWANNRVVPFSDLIIGASTEFKPVGLVAGALGAFLVLVSLLGLAANRLLPRGLADHATPLSQWSMVALLCFLVGGIGNLQAAIAILIGGGSPARGWSRLALIVAKFGAAWAVLIATRWHASRLAKSPAEGTPARWKSVLPLLGAAAVVVVVFADTREVTTMEGVSRIEQPSAFPESGAVEFLRSAESEPCAVLQLPVTDGLLPRTPMEAAERPRFYYRGYIPFLLAPNYTWTYGAVSPQVIAEIEEIADSSLTPGDPALDPFCAVLFDKEAGEILRSEGEPLPGNDVGSLGTPDFANERFEVYLLSGAG